MRTMRPLLPLLGSLLSEAPAANGEAPGGGTTAILADPASDTGGGGEVDPPLGKVKVGAAEPPAATVLGEGCSVFGAKLALPR